jgi:putative methionine-R-sulfoxide reductase with GAF domain
VTVEDDVLGVEDDVLGFVCGAEGSADPVAATLSWLAGRELEIKQLSAEVLNAYREINLVHRFSEKLATLLETASVAEAVIAQACEMAKASQGSILLLNEQSGMFEPISSFQGDTASTHGFFTGGGLLGSIAAAGNAEIVSDFPADPRRSRNDPALTSMICDPLKMKDQIRGVLVILTRS